LHLDVGAGGDLQLLQARQVRDGLDLGLLDLRAK
jgi:hypothetical protein